MDPGVPDVVTDEAPEGQGCGARVFLQLLPDFVLDASPRCVCVCVCVCVFVLLCHGVPFGIEVHPRVLESNGTCLEWGICIPLLPNLLLRAVHRAQEIVCVCSAAEAS